MRIRESGDCKEVDHGAKYEILVDGKPRSMRDAKETAIEAGRFLKHPSSPARQRGSPLLMRRLSLPTLMLGVRSNETRKTRLRAHRSIAITTLGLLLRSSTALHAARRNLEYDRACRWAKRRGRTIRMPT
jgi:hypothetical protein